MNKSEIWYLAGFFDGEGCITVQKQGNTFGIIVQISNTSHSSLELYFKKFGGSITKVKKSKEYHKQAWNWNISCRKAFDFLRIIKPYLKIKKEEAELALEFEKGVSRHFGRRGLSNDEINKRSLLKEKIKELKYR